MKDAALEVHKQNHVTIDNVVDTGVSVDGTWQKRGFTSLNGADAAISIEIGRVLDGEVMTRYCQGCINISVETHKLCYTDYYGDGDSKSFISVEHIYSPKVVKKGMYRKCTKMGWYAAPKT